MKNAIALRDKTTMIARTLIPALKPVVFVTGTLLCEAKVCAEALLVLCVAVLDVERLAVAVLLSLLDKVGVRIDLELMPRIDRVNVVETLALVSVVVDGEVDDGTRNFVLVFCSPETPMIVCAIPPAIENVPSLLVQSHVPSATAEAQHHHRSLLVNRHFPSLFTVSILISSKLYQPYSNRSLRRNYYSNADLYKPLGLSNQVVPRP